MKKVKRKKIKFLGQIHPQTHPIWLKFVRLTNLYAQMPKDDHICGAKGARITWNMELGFFRIHYWH